MYLFIVPTIASTHVHLMSFEMGDSELDHSKVTVKCWSF